MTPSLPFLAAIRVSGAGAPAFLDAQFSQKVSDMAPGTLRLAAWCSPQGRVRALFRVLRAADGGFALVLPRDLADATRSSLARFVLRAPVRIEDGLAPVQDVSHLAADALAALTHGAHPRAPARRLAVPEGPQAGAEESGRSQGADTEAAGQAWRAADISAGLPQVFAASSGLWLPQNLDLEALGGLSYSKGCYPGQEVVARLHYRGTVKQTLRHLEAEPAGSGLATLPAAGTALTDAAGNRVGEVVDAVSVDGTAARALAVVDNASDGEQLQHRDEAGSVTAWRVVPPAAGSTPGP